MKHNSALHLLLLLLPTNSLRHRHLKRLQLNLLLLIFLQLILSHQFFEFPLRHLIGYFEHFQILQNFLLSDVVHVGVVDAFLEGFLFHLDLVLDGVE